MNDAALSALDLPGARLALPLYFPSVSSVKTSLPPVDYVRVLVALSSWWRCFLVSAFDLAHSTDGDQDDLRHLLNQAKAAGTLVMMDSGNYERYWKGAVWQPDEFHTTLQQFACSVALGFDVIRLGEPMARLTNEIVRQYNEDHKEAGEVPVIPVIQAEPDALPPLCVAVAAETGSPMLAVPERRLGEGIVERALTVHSIRTALLKSGQNVALHLLGTGNPTSIGIYVMQGADSFDGLEWCQTVVDHKTGLLHHLSHADLFMGQTEWGRPGLGFHSWVLAHNLSFMASWMDGLRGARQADRVKEFLRSHLLAQTFDACATALEW